MYWFKVPSQLSGGQQQLIPLIRQPKLILADEPTRNLNSSQDEKIMRLFMKLNKERTTIILATHSETNAKYGSRIIHLVDGMMQHQKSETP